MMYSAYKLNKQGDNRQPWRTPFLVLFHVWFYLLLLDPYSGFSETGEVIWYSHLFKNFPQFVVIHTIKDFSVVSEAEIDVFLEFPCFIHDPPNVGILLSDSSNDFWIEGASLVAQMVKNLPAMQETLVRFLGQEDPLEKEMATHSSILAWRIL